MPNTYSIVVPLRHGMIFKRRYDANLETGLSRIVERLYLEPAFKEVGHKDIFRFNYEIAEGSKFASYWYLCFYGCASYVALCSEVDEKLKKGLEATGWIVTS